MLKFETPSLFGIDGQALSQGADYKVVESGGPTTFFMAHSVIRSCLFSVPGPVTVQQGRRELWQRKTRGTALGTQI